GYFVEAVLVFFVLSGFLVGGMVMARLSRGSFDPPGYAVDRFSRLYTAFLPALLLTVALTWIGATWFNGTGLYDASNPTFVEKGTPINFAANAGWSTFLGNAAMLQFYFVEPYGSNPPLWTLSSEFWFYMVFGLFAAGSLKRAGGRIALSVAAALYLLVLGPMFWLYFGMWLIGVAAAVLRPPRLPIALPALALLAAMLLFRRYADAALAPTDLVRFSVQYGICLATGLLLLGWRTRPPQWAVRFGGFNKAMADFSYSLYLTHFPVIILLVAVLGSVTGNPGYASGFAPTDPIALTTYAAAVMLSLAFAWLFSQATERQTAKVRGWLKSRLARASKPGT
ncbi:MAG: acyltransferase family protein, partial [Novosphingobium sp.]